MFKLIHESEGFEGQTFCQPPKRIEMTLNTEDADLTELCQFFGDFLKACSFHYDGTVQIGDDFSDDTLAELTAEHDLLRDEFNELRNRFAGGAEDNAKADETPESQIEFYFPADDEQPQTEQTQPTAPSSEVKE